ncbi:MAG: peptidase M14 [Xanthomonadales bacterium]|nr:peptidase M14 [Xanthomonadales bacterium]
MRALFLFLALTLATPAAAMPAADYLPADADLDPSIPTPESVLGWEVGEWRVSHDQLVKYMETLASASDRVAIRTIGHTHEQRPILQLVFTQPDNHGRLEELRQQHLRAVNGDGSGPLVVWLGHSIHGNEASGSNGALLSAYYLAASRSAFVEELLQDSVILFDPSFNPDGLNRFASWSNSNRSHNPVADPDHRINHEDWPGARTNHYWFDLNRDWLPLVHPESRARVAEFQRWLPHVLTDQHERGRDGYFFQPGIPSRQNPLTPPENLEMTRALAQYHAEAMDAAGEIYFTEDDYDDFYFGKGSTYPDINGGIGILFEQPSIDGPLLERDTGLMTFHESITNQLRTTLSTLRGAHAMRDQLIAYQQGFFESLGQRAANAGFAGWVIGDDGDPARAAEFLALLDQHGVTYRTLSRTQDIDGQTYTAGRAWVLPAKQRQFGVLQALMETQGDFEDETFYDVSAWTQPLAYNLPYARVERLPQTGSEAPSARRATPSRNANAWIIPWGQLEAAATLQSLLDAGALVRAATKPFTAHVDGGQREFSRGALVVAAGLQDENQLEAIHGVLSRAAGEGLDMAETHTSLTPSGPDLGALHFARVKAVKPLLLVGDGVNAYDAGEAWHHFDLRLGQAPVMVEMDRLARVSLDDYTHLVMVDGSYSALATEQKERVAAWVKDGGILIATGRASDWVESLCFENKADGCDSPETEPPNEQEPKDRPYAQFQDDRAQRVIGGAIVAGRLDLTHPLAYGYRRPDLPLFRRGTTLLEASRNAYATPVRYTQEPLLAGFIGDTRQDEIRGAAAVIAERQGEGLVIRFANNPLFRGFWRGTERLFNNAVYFGQLIDATKLPD